MQYLTIPVIITLTIALLAHYFFNKKISGNVQNCLVLFMSYFCYALWSWKFLSLMTIITLLNYYLAFYMIKSTKSAQNKALLISVVIIHVIVFFVFRYNNFFMEKACTNFSVSIINLNIIVPLGIGIYLLQSLSYVIDVYCKKITKASDIISFAAFTSFFPTLIVGPVERASTLLPQFSRKREVDNESIITGVRRILWGIFKIFVVANSCAIYSDEAFLNYRDYTGLTIFIGLTCLAFQLYAYISGLSDIAVGIGKMFGFNLTTNFKFPYFSKNIPEFWNKWNISLLNWINQYVATPLLRAKNNKISAFMGLAISFTLIALWHGGKGYFIVFGLLNSLFFIPRLIKNKGEEVLKFTVSNDFAPIDFVKYIFTFLLIITGLTFFRAGSANEALEILKNLSTNIFSVSMWELRSLGNGFGEAVTHVFVLLVYVIIEWIQRKQDFALELLKDSKRIYLNWLLPLIIILMVLFLNEVGPDYSSIIIF
jgi:alginate O-acetyltransferase complex protein AlgI